MKTKRKSSLFGGNAIFIYGLVAMIVVAYIFYFHSYIPNKEKILHNKGIRTLENINDAIHGKVLHYQQMVDQKMEVKYVMNEGEKFEAEKKVLENHFDLSLKTHIPADDSIFRDRDIGLVYEEDILRVLFKSKMTVKEFNARISKIKGKSILGTENSLNLDTIGSAEFKANYITWAVAVQDFMNGLFENELFECLVLIDEDKHEVVFSNAPNLIDVGAHFKEGEEKANSYGVHVDSASVNSLPYQEFCREVKIAGKSFIILGLMSNETIKNYTKQVSYWVLLIVFFITIILIFSVPTIKIFVLNTWERMKDSDATFSAIGLIALVFFITLMLSSLSYFYQLNNETDKDIKKYNEQLMSELRNEFDEYLVILDTLDLKNSTQISRSKEIKYHEIFDVDKESLEINSIVFPYDSAIFQDGNFLNEIFTNNSNIRKRDYVKEVANGNGFLFQSETKKDKEKFFIQSVFSFNRGQTEAVISKWNTDENRINCISTDLKSLMLNLPAEGFGYALINKQGKVLFSSKKARNNFKNLKRDISEEGFIQRALTTESEQEGKYEYGKDVFKGFISPVGYIEKQGAHPLFLITYADMNVVEWQTGVDTIITAACAGIIPACFIFLIILWRFTRVGEDKSSSIENTHTYNFLFPDATKWSEYIFLSGVSLVYIFTLYCFFLNSGFRSSTVAIASMIIMYAVIRVYLLADKMGYDRSKRGAYYAIAFFVLIVIMYLAKDQYNENNIYGMAILNMVLFLSALVFKRINKRNYSRYRGAKIMHTISTFLWLVAGVISPIVLISDQSESLVERSFNEMVTSLYSEKATTLNEKLANNYAAYSSVKEWKIDPVLEADLINAVKKKSVQVDIVQKDSITSQNFAPIFYWITNFFQNRYSWLPKYKSGQNDSRVLNYGKRYILFLFLCVLFVLIHYFFKRLFFNVPDIIPSEPISYPRVCACLDEHARMLKGRNKPLRLFLVGSPRSKREELIKRITDQDKKTAYIDLHWYPGSVMDTYDQGSMLNKLIGADIIVIDNWYPADFTAEYVEKINLLTSYFNSKDTKDKDVILLSNYTVTQMEQNWSNLVQFTGDEKVVKSIIRALSSWIFNFREFLVPIQNFVFDEPKAVEMMGMEEINSYLNKSYYSPAYSSIWNSLTQNERFILYDLSDDDLLNTHDHNTLLKLYLKGLIINNQRLYKIEAFQQSFRLFIKHGVSADELREIEYLSAKNGSWKTFRIGLYLLILALLVFSYKLNPGVIQGFGTIAGGAISFAAVFSQLSGNFNMQSITGMFKKKG